MKWGNEIAGYLLDISCEEMKVAKREKWKFLSSLKRLPPVAF